MNAEELKDNIPLAALGRLSKPEEAELEAELADNPQLAALLREHEDMITGLWHSAAPLQTMPKSAWGELRERMSSESDHSRQSSHCFSSILFKSGWAAAAILMLVLFLQKNPHAEKQTARISLESEQNGLIRIEKKSANTNHRSSLSPREQAQREKIAALRSRLEAVLANRDGSTIAPQIIELHRPGEIVDSDPKTRSKRLLALLTGALQSDLQKLDEEVVSLIIEDGWLNSALEMLPKDTVVRHRKFPAENFGDFRLLKSLEGHFYDPASNFLWKPAPDGGGYLGELAPEDIDLSVFVKSPEEEPGFEVESQESGDTRLVELSPAQGYVLRDGDDGEPTFVLNGIDNLNEWVAVRQSDKIAPLQQAGLSELLANVDFGNQIVTSGNRSGDSIGTPRQIVDSGSAISVPSGPQLMEVPSWGSDGISWNEPFEIVKYDANGNETVIMTSSP